MKRFGLMGLAAALVVAALGFASEIQAGEMLDAGFAYGGWGGPMGWGYGGPALSYYGNPYYGYTGPGGYAGGGGWGYAGSCCTNIWAGYCNEEGGCGPCRVKRRCRPLGCGAGPCCQSGCGSYGCGPACGPADAGYGSLAPPCGRRLFGRHRYCNVSALCGPAMGYGGCCNGDMGYGYEGGVVPGGYDDGAVSAPAEVEETPAPAPEQLEGPAPAPEVKPGSST